MSSIIELPQPDQQTVDASQPLEWVSRHVMRGRNIHHTRTVICVRVQLGRWRGQMVSYPPAFTAECIARLLQGAKAPPNQPQVQALQKHLLEGEPISLELLLLECVLVLERHLAAQRFDFIPIESVDVRGAGSDGEVELVWSTHDPMLSAAVSRLVVGEFNRLLAITQGLPPPPAKPLDEERAELERRSQRRVTPVTTSALLLAAHHRGLYADPRGGPTVQFGQGKLQRLAHSTVFDGETMASARLARHKGRTARRLLKLGLPAPRQSVVHSVEEAVAAARRIGFPVVVKPLRGSGGSGVSVGVGDADAMVSAAERARDSKGSFLVEQMVLGNTFRLLVVGGRFTAALRLDQPYVNGDGQRSMREIIDALNADPARDVIRLAPVEVDAAVVQCLAAQGHTLDSVPESGEVVTLRGAANIGSGSIHTDVTDLVHKAHADLAERAAAGLGLLTAGVDVISRDIGLPPGEAHTAIVEVNARPGLHTHMFPYHGTPRPVADRVLDIIFPPPANGCIPTALVLGQRGGLATAEGIASELQRRDVTVGVATRQRCSIAGVRFDEEDLSLNEGVTRMWRDPRVAALVLAVDPRRAVANGLVVEAGDVLCLLPHDAAPGADDYVQAVLVAAPAFRTIVARRGDDTLVGALEAVVQSGGVAPDAIHWLPADAGRAEFVSAVASRLVSPPVH